MMKGKPHMRTLFIPVPTQGQSDSHYRVPRGCAIISHCTFKQKGVPITQLIVDISKEDLENGPDMPSNWDYRSLMRDQPSARSVGRASLRRKT